MFALIQKKQTTFDAIKGHNNDITGSQQTEKGRHMQTCRKMSQSFFSQTFSKVPLIIS